MRESGVVVRAQAGDIEAFEFLVGSYQGELLRLAFRMLRNYAEAEDVVQDTFVLVWRRFSTLENVTAFHGWIYQIATRRCLQLIRARDFTVVVDDLGRQIDPQPLGEDTSGDKSPEMFAQRSARRVDLQLAVAQLPVDQRVCWVLRNLNDLSYAQIAQVTGAPVSTVRGRLARARRSLAWRMAPWR